MRDLQELTPNFQKLDLSEMRRLVRSDPGDAKRVDDLKKKIKAIEACQEVLEM
jgi:hypothetical protein